MSGSDHPQIFANQKKEEVVDSETAAEERESEKEKTQDGATDHRTESPEQLIKNEDDLETDRATVSHRELSEDDDGFKTPTSPNHRIPVIKQCPPAPMKLRPPPSKLKRKASSPPPRSSPSIQPEEVESIFSPIANDQEDDAQRHKIKKARAESSDDQ